MEVRGSFQSVGELTLTDRPPLGGHHEDTVKPLRYEDLMRTMQKITQMPSAADRLRQQATHFQKARVTPDIYIGIDPEENPTKKLGADWMVGLGERGLLWVVAEKPAAHEGTAVAIFQKNGRITSAEPRELFGYQSNVLIEGNPAIFGHRVLERLPAARMSAEVQFYDFPSRFPADLPPREEPEENDQ